MPFKANAGTNGTREDNSFFPTTWMIFYSNINQFRGGRLSWKTMPFNESTNYRPLMELDGSLPCSTQSNRLQELATCCLTPEALFEIPSVFVAVKRIPQTCRLHRKHRRSWSVRYCVPESPSKQVQVQHSAQVVCKYTGPWPGCAYYLLPTVRLSIA